MRTLTKRDCRVLTGVVKPSKLGANGQQIYSRLVQEAYGVPLDMARLLTRSRIPLNDLARKLRTSRRTVFRYLVALQDIGCTVDLNGDGYRITKPGRILAGLLK